MSDTATPAFVEVTSQFILEKCPPIIVAYRRLRRREFKQVLAEVEAEFSAGIERVNKVRKFFFMKPWVHVKQEYSEELFQKYLNFKNTNGLDISGYAEHSEIRLLNTAQFFVGETNKLHALVDSAKNHPANLALINTDDWNVLTNPKASLLESLEKEFPEIT